MNQLNRTYLFAPGNHARKVDKVFTVGADVAILDLEDAVAISEKPDTRTTVVKALQSPRTCRGYVRINALDTEFCFEDIETVVQEGVDGIVLPKVERAADLQMVDWMITSLERKRGLPEGSIDLMPIIETGMGISNARQICAAGGRLKRISFGAGDYTRDMGIEWSLEEDEIYAAQAEVVLASRINDLEPPIDTVFIHIREHDHFAASARRARRFGFQGKLCIHPDQVGPTNDVFTPTAPEVLRANRIIEAFEDAEKNGSASIQVDGYFVDYPIVVKARRIIGMANAVRAETKP